MVWAAEMTAAAAAASAAATAEAEAVGVAPAASEKKSPVGKFVVGALQSMGIVEADFLTALAAAEAADF
jgi:hypothetical protein